MLIHHLALFLCELPLHIISHFHIELTSNSYLSLTSNYFSPVFEDVSFHLIILAKNLGLNSDYVFFNSPSKLFIWEIMFFTFPVSKINVFHVCPLHSNLVISLLALFTLLSVDTKSTALKALY